MAFKLCLRLGVIHPDVLLEQLTSYQLSEWEAFDSIEPIGDKREDIRMAIIASVMYNLAVDIHGKKGTKHKDIIDFLPEWSGEEKEIRGQSIEEMKNILLTFAKRQNEKVAKSKKVEQILEQRHLKKETQNPK